MVYLKLNAVNNIFEIENPLDPESFRVGETYQDYLDNKFVPLSEEQVEFYRKYPNYNAYQIWNMIEPEVPEPYVRTLMDAKFEKQQAISRYDNSESVNSFIINNTIRSWFKPEERTNYKQSIESAKLLGVDKLTFCIGDQFLEITPSMADMMLAQIQLYADQCFLVTKQHLLNVNSLETIEEVDNYDYKTNYPAVLNFQL